MKFSGRINSFVFKGNCDVFQAIDTYRNLEGITHLEFNYPEHILPYSISQLKEHFGPLKVNGVATRFRSPFAGGEFTNPSEEMRQKAVQLCLDAVDACKDIGGSVLTIWLGYDGFDYAFQVDYEKNWDIIIRSFREIAEYAKSKQINISIEYKPFEPRSFSMIDGIGTTLLALNEIGMENVGVTLDFCHMLMKQESPSYSLALAARKGKVFGLHLNDGYGIMDSGLIFGSVNLIQALELVYYIKKYKYDGVVFFDSFPVREDAASEISSNIKSFQYLSSLVEKAGMDRISQVITQQDGVCAQNLILELLNHSIDKGAMR